MKSFLRTVPHVILVAAGVLAAAGAGAAPLQDELSRLAELEALVATDPERALELARARLADSSADSDAQLAARIVAAECLLALQRFEEARESAAHTVQAARAAESPRLVDALTAHGVALVRTGPLQAARAALEEAVPLTQSEARRVRTLNALAVTHSGLGEFDHAAATYQRALAVADAAGLAHPSIRLRANIGTLYNQLGRHEKALGVFDEALERRAALEDTSLPRYPILSGKAVALQGLERLEDALALQTLALEELRAADDRRAETNVLNNIGSLQLDLGRPLEALESLGAALSLSDELKLERARATILLNLSNAQLALEKIEAAYDSALRSLSSAETSGSLPSHIQALEALAQCARLSGRHADAALHLERALSLERERRSLERGDFALLEGTLAGQEHARQDELRRKDRELELERFRAERFQREVFAIGLGLLVLVGAIGWSVRSVRRSARERIDELERRLDDLHAERREQEAELVTLRQAFDDMAHILPRCAGCGSVRRSDGVWEAVAGLRRAPLHAGSRDELCPRCWQRALEESTSHQA